MEAVQYIQKTLHSPALLKFHNRLAKSQEKWQSLEVLSSYLDPSNPNIGYVEFIAKYKKDKQIGCIHELSEFHCINGRWY